MKNSDEQQALNILLPHVPRSGRLVAWCSGELVADSEKVEPVWIEIQLDRDGKWWLDVTFSDDTSRVQPYTWQDVLDESGCTPRELCLDAIARIEARIEGRTQTSAYLDEDDEMTRRPRLAAERRKAQELSR